MKSCFDKCVIEKKKILMVTQIARSFSISFHFSINYIDEMGCVHPEIFPEQCLVSHLRQVIKSFEKARFSAG